MSNKIILRSLISSSILFVVIFAFQNCGQFQPLNYGSNASNSSSPFGGNLDLWTAHAIGHAEPYTAKEAVDNLGFHLSVGSGNVLYLSNFSDGNWQVVLADLNNNTQKVLANASNFPGYELSTNQSIYVAEQGVLLTILQPQLMMSRTSSGLGILVAIPVGSGTPWAIDTNVIGGVTVTQDGSSVSYLTLASFNAAATSVKFSKISAPNPVTFGQIPYNGFLPQTSAVSRSHSPFSNQGFIYYQTTSGPPATFALFGPSGGATAMPASVQTPQVSSLQVANAGLPAPTYSSVDGDSAGQYLYISGSLFNVTTGTVVSNSIACASSDLNYFLSGVTQSNSVSFEIFGPMGSINSTLAKFSGTNGSNNINSCFSASNDKFFAIGMSAGQIFQVSSSGGSLLSSGTLPANTYLYSIAPGDHQLLQTFSSQGAQTVQLASFNEKTIAPVNLYYPGDLSFWNGHMVAPENWGIYVINPDGTQGARLDPPMPGESTFTTPNPSIYYGAPNELLSVDPSSSNLIFQRALNTASYASQNSPIYGLFSLNSQGQLMQLSNLTEQTGQMVGTQNFNIWESQNLVTFNSADCSYDQRTIGWSGGAMQDPSFFGCPKVLSEVSLSGQNQIRLSSTNNYNSYYGEGTEQNLGSAFGPLPQTQLFHGESSSSESGFRGTQPWTAQSTSFVHNLNGGLILTLTGMLPGLGDFDVFGTESIASPNGNWIFFQTMVLPTNNLVSSASIAVPNASAIGNSYYFGVLNLIPASGGVLTPSITTFTSSSQILYQNPVTNFTYIFDPAQPTIPPISTNLLNSALAADGNTIIGFTPDGTLAVGHLSSLNSTTLLGVGNYTGITSDQKLIYVSSGSVLSYDLLAGGSPISITDPSLNAGSFLQTNLINQSFSKIPYEYLGLGGNKVVYQYSPTATPGTNCVWGVANSLGSTSLLYPDPQCLDWLSLTTDGNYAIVQKATATDYTLAISSINLSTGLGSETNLLEPQELAIYIWQAHHSDWLTVLAVESDSTQQLFAIKADGSSRINLGSPFSLAQQIVDVRFFNNDKSVLVQGNPVSYSAWQIYRFDLQ